MTTTLLRLKTELMTSTELAVAYLVCTRINNHITDQQINALPDERDEYYSAGLRLAGNEFVSEVKKMSFVFGLD